MGKGSDGLNRAQRRGERPLPPPSAPAAPAEPVEVPVAEAHATSDIGAAAEETSKAINATATKQVMYAMGIVGMVLQAVAILLYLMFWLLLKLRPEDAAANSLIASGVGFAMIIGLSIYAKLWKERLFSLGVLLFFGSVSAAMGAVMLFGGFGVIILFVVAAVGTLILLKYVSLSEDSSDDETTTSEV